MITYESTYYSRYHDLAHRNLWRLLLTHLTRSVHSTFSPFQTSFVLLAFCPVSLEESRGAFQGTLLSELKPKLTSRQHAASPRSARWLPIVRGEGHRGVVAIARDPKITLH